MQFQQIVLAGRGFSGRGVRFRQLQPHEVDAANRDAAKQVGKEATGIEFNQQVVRELIERALVAVTKAGGHESMDQIIALPQTAWVEIHPALLNEPDGQFSYNRLFTAKDDHALGAIVSRLHVAKEDEIEAIMGKALMVSGD